MNNKQDPCHYADMLADLYDHCDTKINLERPEQCKTVLTWLTDAKKICKSYELKQFDHKFGQLLKQEALEPSSMVPASSSITIK